ncbi:septum formation initiator family protein [Vallitalea pronyensis]|uniref:Septum formation initiator family protein n=1 Tax=Vallitalea pronyensis TaxID=1348613 RepID=A0A8J8MGE4_9FIRM|nr:septum formation initiator family protein [Vallitalea pronyensis]QUI20823.1 septum formation initiator family protein [Vallitalea pronyensis]
MKKKSYRRKKRAMLFATLVLMLLTVVVSIQITSLYTYNKKQEKEKLALERQIEEERERYIELLQEREYMKSDAYIEELAREKFGLVKPGEIIFINEDEGDE